jgi:hypothetical protein
MKIDLAPLLLFGLVGQFTTGSAQQAGTFAATGSMKTPRAAHTATLLTNGKVLITGGGNVWPYQWATSASAELYDPASGTFTRTGDITTPRDGHTATLLPDGRVLIAGGEGSNGTGLASAELYDPAAGTFARTGDMTIFRSRHTATLLPSGNVLIAGGQFQPPYTAELYDSSSATFTTVGPLPVNASHLTLLADGDVLIQVMDDETGFPGVRTRINAALYDPLPGTFRLDGESVRDYWTIATATLLTTGNVLNTVLVTDEGWPTDVAELYDPSTGVFAARKMAAFRRESTSTLLPDATVLIAGGGDTDLGWSNAATNGAELYDPAADKFSVTGSMTENREGHTATLLPDGTVLVAGGGINGIGSATAEIYHPNVLMPAPALLSLSGDSRGPGAILHAGTARVVSSSDPAVAGEALEIYGTGLIDGSVIPPKVAIGGQMADILYFGKVPAWPGLNQINVRVPSGVTPGASLPVRLNYLNRPSNEVTLAVK